VYTRPNRPDVRERPPSIASAQHHQRIFLVLAHEMDVRPPIPAMTDQPHGQPKVLSDDEPAAQAPLSPSPVLRQVNPPRPTQRRQARTHGDQPASPSTANPGEDDQGEDSATPRPLRTPKAETTKAVPPPRTATQRTDASARTTHDALSELSTTPRQFWRVGSSLLRVPDVRSKATLRAELPVHRCHSTAEDYRQTPFDPSVHSRYGHLFGDELDVVADRLERRLLPAD
jgi:hypothetical protein